MIDIDNNNEPQEQIEHLELLIDSACGIYIPQMFAQYYEQDSTRWRNVDKEDIKILLEGPYHEDYWDIWVDVENAAIYTDPDTGIEYALHHDGDLFLIQLDK